MSTSLIVNSWVLELSQANAASGLAAVSFAVAEGPCSLDGLSSVGVRITGTLENIDPLNKVPVKREN